VKKQRLSKAEKARILEEHLKLVEERVAEHRANPQPMRPGHVVLDELDAEYLSD
jgi:hypothetical protein